MNIFKILVVLTVFAPGIAFAHSAELHDKPTSNVSAVDVSLESVNTKGSGSKTGDDKRVDNGTTGGDVQVRSEKAESKLDDDSDDDGISDEETRTRSDDDGLDEMGIEVVENNDDEEDSFYNVFADDLNDDDDAKEAVRAFIKIDDIKGESADSSSKTKSEARKKDLKEIVILGSEVREKAQKNKVEVRGWDPEKKKVTITPDDVKKGGDFINLVGAITLSDKNIKKVSFNQEEITIKYIQPAKLFGFIPMSLTAKVELSKKNKVKVKFPWYTFLTKNNAKEVKKEIDVLSFSWGAATDKKDTDLKERARRFQTISNLLKAKHDVMAAIIQNIK